MRRSLTRMLTTIIVSITGGLLTPSFSQSQGGHGHVTITSTADKLIAWPAAGGGIEESLKPGESVVRSGARGHTGFAQTSTRLLGFSAGLRQWREVSLGVEERMERYQLLPFLILAHTNQHVYGFQETRGHWTATALGPSETVTQLRGQGHVAVAITTERALGFSTYTGGFFDLSWTPQERVLSVDGSQHGIVVHTSTRTVIFKSQSNGWSEVR